MSQSANANCSTPQATPTITILLLGSPSSGKATFLNALPHVEHKISSQTLAAAAAVSSSSSSDTGFGSGSNVDAAAVVAAAKSTAQPSQSPFAALSPVPPPNPSSFAVSLYARPYTIDIHRNTSTLLVDPFPERVSCLVLTYDVSDRKSFYNMQHYYRRVFAERYELELGLHVPIMMLGLKRDLRTDQKVDLEREIPEQGTGLVQGTTSERYVCVMPEEAVQVANELGCDRYAECSAATGELMWEVLNDLTRMAARTTKGGGFSEREGCVIL